MLAPSWPNLVISTYSLDAIKYSNKTITSVFYFLVFSKSIKNFVYPFYIKEEHSDSAYLCHLGPTPRLLLKSVRKKILQTFLDLDIVCSLCFSPHFLKISLKSIFNFLSYFAAKQTNATNDKTSLVELKKAFFPHSQHPNV